MSVKWHPQSFLKALDNRIDRKLKQTGEIVKMNAKSNCPVKSGRLRDSITEYIDEENKTVSVGSPLEYAKYIELGTRNSPPKAFLRRAIAESTATIKRIFGRA